MNRPANYYLLSLLFVFIIQSTVFAQSSSSEASTSTDDVTVTLRERIAEDYYLSGSYDKALSMYGYMVKEIIDNGEESQRHHSKEYFISKIADCHYRMGDRKYAIRWYKKLEETDMFSEETLKTYKSADLSTIE